MNAFEDFYVACIVQDIVNDDVIIFKKMESNIKKVKKRFELLIDK